MLLYKELPFTHIPEITSQLLLLAQELNPNKSCACKFEINLLKERIPLLHQQLMDMGLVVSNFREFVAEPYGGLGIHRDGTEKYNKICALNWPIENTAGTQMVWWQLNEGAIPAQGKDDPSYENDPRYDSGNTIYFYDEKDAVEIGAVEIIKPLLVSVQDYHSIRNYQQKYRRMISIRFENEPVHLLTE